MFEIGNSLREARLRQNLDFVRLEAGTRIRSKYLEALESEHFEVLPGESYVKGFLRTYAEYLGLDGQLYVDEFNSRFASSEEPLAPSTPRHKPRHRASESNLVVVALAAIVAVTVLVVVAFGFGDGTPVDEGIGRVGEETASAPAATTDASEPTEPAAGKKRKLAKLVLTAAGGDCWLQVKAGSARGEILFEGTLEEGQTQRFAKWKRLYLTLGNPASLRARLNGKAATRFPGKPASISVTAKGIRTVSTS